MIRARVDLKEGCPLACLNSSRTRFDTKVMPAPISAAEGLNLRLLSPFPQIPSESQIDRGARIHVLPCWGYPFRRAPCLRLTENSRILRHWHPCPPTKKENKYPAKPRTFRATSREFYLPINWPTTETAGADVIYLPRGFPSCFHRFMRMKVPYLT